ncbi:MAG: hypothetical protein GY820_26235 [Gammaproteobacteria bacterium]|nr:hypothetical protein [Gammaproteobacteria bacterium]
MFDLRILLCLGLTLLLPGEVVASETVIDPMKPPAFALNKFRLAKLKSSSKAENAASKKTTSTTKPLQLTSVLIAKDRKVAIINQQMMVVGERISKARLVKISKDSVQLLKNGKRIILKLENELTAIRKTAAQGNL